MWLFLKPKLKITTAYISMTRRLQIRVSKHLPCDGFYRYLNSFHCLRKNKIKSHGLKPGVGSSALTSSQTTVAIFYNSL